jgi:hypothetical protein
MRRGAGDGARAGASGCNGTVTQRKSREAVREPSFAAAVHRGIAAVRRVGIARCATGAQIRDMDMRRSKGANP